MNDRKQHVLEVAHQLFIDNGFQATSIQDIIENSGISKGTFYNYFSSKNELFIVLFKSIQKKFENDRDELLIGKDPCDIEIFIKQIEVQMKEIKKDRTFSLIGEIIYSNNEDLKPFVKQGKTRLVHWVYNRFIDIFGENKKQYLLDIAIMFIGYLIQNIRFHHRAYGTDVNIHAVVRYSVKRLIKMVDEVAESDDQLLEPGILEVWLPDCQKSIPGFQMKCNQSISKMKKMLENDAEYTKYMELLDFVKNELIISKNPRKYLIGCTFESMKAKKDPEWQQELSQLENQLKTYFEFK
jgi:AcrR family transcriptional regulator